MEMVPSFYGPQELLVGSRCITCNNRSLNPHTNPQSSGDFLLQKRGNQGRQIKEVVQHHQVPNDRVGTESGPRRPGPASWTLPRTRGSGSFRNQHREVTQPEIHGLELKFRPFPSQSHPLASMTKHRPQSLECGVEFPIFCYTLSREKRLENLFY